jgi:RNA polymerase sigma factor (TIGR02999 family)
MPLMYDELRSLAGRHIRREYHNHTLCATELVNEVYLKLVNQQRLDAGHRKQFIAMVSQTMRNFLIDYARTKKRLKRGEGIAPVPLKDVEHFLTNQEADEILALDEALVRLEQLDERAAKVVQYRFYGGLTLQETADTLGLSVKSVQRGWIAGRAWLRKEVSGEDS